MAVGNVTLRAPLGDSVWSDTAATNSLVDVNGSGTSIYHVEIDNTANTAVTYVKMFDSAASGVTLATTEPDIVISCAAGVKEYMSIPTAISTSAALCYIATSVLANNSTQTAPTTAIGLTISYS
jgi:hypothetical protein